MNDLIKINYDTDKVTVLGRDLYEILEIETPYTIWIKRMIEYGFVADEDFITFLLESTGGRPSENHQLTIEMAKEICMLQRSEKGKMIRLYFLECEKKLKQLKIPQTYSEALLEAGRLAAEKEILQLERDEAINTKAQIGSKREASAMNKASQLSKQIRKLTDNEKREGEYTAGDVAIKAGVYSENGNPHVQMVSGFLSTLTDKNKYIRKYKIQIDTGQIVDGIYYNEIFVNEFLRYFSNKKDDTYNCNGRNYKFRKLGVINV